ncbi:helix-turn-helix domain-containing protein [uncultured Shewanella sp.]|uniref:helix-turn-helix domain-containing protein n=1 Tax=uncultured Shewanella sp. TaxID=173975 RepID=UPI00261C8F39|nr:helix-turn-helix domain-containing protein [uncultured Shewanella sp.]
MRTALDFTLFQPQKRFVNDVQALWSASVVSRSEQPVERWLNSDACSGMLFILGSDIDLDDTSFSKGVLLLPVSKKAQLIRMPPRTQLVGVRFHPGISFSFFGTLYRQPKYVPLNIGEHFSADLNGLYCGLGKRQGHYAKITALYRWLLHTIESVNGIPLSLMTALNALSQNIAVGSLREYVSLSQRQTERQFKTWMNMTPKYYQRILRVKSAMKVLKERSELSLVAIATNQGFTDQAHMNREFKHIANITPREYRIRLQLMERG